MDVHMLSTDDSLGLANCSFSDLLKKTNWNFFPKKNYKKKLCSFLQIK